FACLAVSCLVIVPPHAPPNVQFHIYQIVGTLYTHHHTNAFSALTRNQPSIRSSSYHNCCAWAGLAPLLVRRTTFSCFPCCPGPVSTHLRFPYITIRI